MNLDKWKLKYNKLEIDFLMTIFESSNPGLIKKFTETRKIQKETAKKDEAGKKGKKKKE